MKDEKTESTEPVFIDISDEDRITYLVAYATEHFRPESVQVMQDMLDADEGIDTAFSQAGINEIINDALELAISIERQKE